MPKKDGKKGVKGKTAGERMKGANKFV